MIKIPSQEFEQQPLEIEFDDIINSPQKPKDNRLILLIACATLLTIGIIINVYEAQKKLLYQNQCAHFHSGKFVPSVQHQLRTTSHQKTDLPDEIIPFKNILWVQTDKQLNAKDMIDALVANNHKHFGVLGGFEVRVIDDLSAYDYISEQTQKWIKETHQQSSVRIPVYELLRLALLYEHGGLSLRLPNIILTEKLDWAQAIINGKTLFQAKTKENSALETGDRSSFSCQTKVPNAVVMHRDVVGGYQFMDDFIVARPKAKIFKKLMAEIAEITKEGIWPHPNYNVTVVDADTLAVSFPNIVQALLNVYDEKYKLCEEFKISSFHEDDRISLVANQQNARMIMQMSDQSFQKKYGKVNMIRLQMQLILDDIIDFIKKGAKAMEDNSLLKTKLMMVQGNKWLTTVPKNHRKVHFCVVSLKAQKLKQGSQSAKDQQLVLSRQSFRKWNLVSFVEGLPDVAQNITERITLVNASEYQGLNLQRAATKYCHQQSIILLLDNQESFSNNEDLQTLAKHFEPIGTYAAFFNIKTKKEMYKPSKESLGIVNRVVYEPNYRLLSDLANSLRAFTVQSYRFVPYFTLCQATTGRYFDREIALLAVVQAEGDQSKCLNSRLIYHLKRLEALIDIPRKKVNTEIIINNGNIRIVQKSTFEYFYKLPHYSICKTIEYFYSLPTSIDNLVVLNNGREEKGLESRKNMPELISRKIHQVWIKEAIPPFKQFLMKRHRETHPDYEYFLWTEENITRQNFPESYDIMQVLLKFDKKSPYNKMSMLSDLIRHEAVYLHGGFYLDTNYMLFGDRALDKFLTYSFVAGTEYAPFTRADRNSGFFGASKHSPHMERIINRRALSSRNYFSEKANLEAGPGFFGKSLKGDQQLDETVFLVAMEQIYPYYFQGRNRCVASIWTPDSEVLFRSEKNRYLKNCEKTYDFAIGIDFFDEGATWQKRRW